MLQELFVGRYGTESARLQHQKKQYSTYRQDNGEILN
jgi:hypothetical protein